MSVKVAFRLHLMAEYPQIPTNTHDLTLLPFLVKINEITAEWGLRPMVNQRMDLWQLKE